MTTIAERLAPLGPNGRRAEILVKQDDLRVILLTMVAGAELHERSAPGTITVQPISGQFIFRVDDAEWTLDPGSLLTLPANVPNAVRAEAGGVLLLTFAWHGERAATAAHLNEQG